ncbi:DEAD/DEAH box helicase [Comamonas guangdongensis]|uniref:DEAD/DEAH box helicase n=1 Tax=Comamonas guangdongensis TaxID=510515 RepID=A0ABV3ZZB2_9BURK
MSFDSLGLSPTLATSALDLGLADPTPIQTQAIPAVLAGRDLWACAPTGSGKTLAYLLPLLQRWLAPSAKRAHTGFVRPLTTLILVPTRELALQVHESLSDLGRTLRDQPRSRVVYGGVSINPQMMQLRGSADFLVATPGRLLDLVEHNAVRLNTVQQLVLDEADRLLDQGFAEELNRVLALLPSRRQTLLFSATFPQNVEALAGRLLQDPVRVQVDADRDAEHSASPENISQRAIAVDGTRRTQLLRQLVKDGEAQPGWERALVFVAKRHTAEMLADKLYKAGIYATTFHGDMSQGARKEVLDQFKAKRWQLLITTDLAARGIDIAQLPAVINYDLPRSPADYIHRIGRTGRAGHAGVAITFVTPADSAHWQLICKRNQLDITLEQIAGFEPTEAPPPPPVAQDGNGGIKGRRPSKKDKLRAAGLLPSKPAQG